MFYRVEHTNRYNYRSHVSLCHNLVHLEARDAPWQTCLKSELRVSHPPAVSIPQTDYFGNRATFFTVQEPHDRLEVTAVNEVRIHPCIVPEPISTPAWEIVRDRIRLARDPVGLDAYQFTFDSQYVKRSPELAAFALVSFGPGRPWLDAALDLMRRIFEEFEFDPTATTIETPIHDLLANRRGVCQDFAHLAIGCLRSLGLAARYVSGYLLTNPPPGQPRLIGADVSHAWLSVYYPGFGWIDLDPTNNIIPSYHHVTLAWGRDYDDVSPIKGVILGGGRHSVSVSVDVAVVEQSG
jgi:transglutaminase-like putative cysteine protease